jgi:polysaccharide deacetylase family protein (PEP-CTERM system associated)
MTFRGSHTRKHGFFESNVAGRFSCLILQQPQDAGRGGFIAWAGYGLPARQGKQTTTRRDDHSLNVSAALIRPAIDPQSQFTADIASAATGPCRAANVRRDVLTVSLQDYFQVGTFRRLVSPERWDRFETRLEVNTANTLELLDRFNTKATFFVLGWIADRYPELVRQVAERGHEVASSGFYHKPVAGREAAEFRDDLARAREAIQSASGQTVRGFRAADGWIGPKDLWALDVLAEQGYAWDSSMMPTRWGYGHAGRRVVHQHTARTGTIWEVPPSTINLFGLRLPIAGGNWFRQIPHSILKRAVARWHRKRSAPFVMYFHTWELDPEQPRITAAGTLGTMRHYRNLDKMSWVLEDYLSRYSFAPIADVLGLPALETLRSDDVATRADAAPIRLAALSPSPSNASHVGTHSTAACVAEDAPESREPVTVVIPCYNEERTIPYLARTLDSVRAALAAKWQPTFLFVDDYSRDATWDGLNAKFGSQADCRLVRHETNKGVAAAILTGIQAADSEIVCSIDCDCSYDPLELAVMIPKLTDDVDLVTASPYHPEGRVANVPNWRLGLSKTSSWMYRCVFGRPMHTWTSCFRIYRKSALANIEVKHGNFLGIAEMLCELCLKGSKIVEHPATLDVRIFGQSKMKVLRTILGHLKLLQGFARRRMFGEPKPAAVAAKRAPQPTLDPVGVMPHQT